LQLKVVFLTSGITHINWVVISEFFPEVADIWWDTCQIIGMINAKAKIA
jgi:hypothetical protein